MKRRRLLLGLLALGLLLLALWPASIRPAVLHTYSDNAFGMWGLTLYQDGQFTIYLPADQSSGQYKVIGDTIELHYPGQEKHLPAAYLINRERRRIDELELVAGRWHVREANNWAALAFDSTRYYGR